MLYSISCDVHHAVCVSSSLMMMECVMNDVDDEHDDDDTHTTYPQRH